MFIIFSPSKGMNFNNEIVSKKEQNIFLKKNIKRYIMS